MIPYGRHEVSADDIEAVVRVLQSEFLTQGPCVPAFEQQVMEYCEVRYAIAVNSATSALHISCLALGVGVGDIVWTSPITFVATANCARYCGADVDFVDIDPDTYNMSVDKLAEKLKLAERLNKLPKVVIPVHLCGQSCDMARIFELSQIYGFKIIEDASHAVGGGYLNRPVGCCHYSDITVFSFHPVKIITSGEGGMVLTNNVEILNRVALLRSHGITRDLGDMLPHLPEEIWQYQQIMLGFNYRMTDIQAALGLSQMKRLSGIVAMRNKIAERYDVLLKELPIKLPFRNVDSYSSFHLYVIRIESTKLHRSQKRIIHALQKDGIGASLHYIPVYRQPYYERLGFEKGYCPEAEKYFTSAISLPLYPNLSQDQQNSVVNALKTVML